MRAMPMRQGVSIAGLLAAFLLGSLASRSGHGAWALAGPVSAAKPRIAVVGVTAEQLSAEVRAKIDAAIAGGLAASGADVVDSTTTARRIATKGLGGCETSTCRVAIAEVTGVGYLVRGSVESMGRSYTVHLDIIDGATGNVIGSREDRCEICTESEAYETASVTASALKAEVLKRPAPAASAGGAGGGGDARPGERPLAASESVAAAATASSRDTPTILAPASGAAPARDERAPRFRTLSWIGIGAGVLAVGVGAALVTFDGHPSCHWSSAIACHDELATRTPGFAVIGVGAAVAIASAVLLIGRF